MAFQQSKRQPIQRPVRPATPEPATHIQSSRTEAAIDESQTWVLFSPPTEATTASYLSGTAHSIETPGRSRLSDVGSLDFPRSSHHDMLEDGAEDDAELDSLDSHLPEFRSIPEGLESALASAQHSMPLFPSHDGLGSFRLDRPALGQDAQDHIYRFERFNRNHRRAGSFEPIQPEHDAAHAQEAEKRLRIEAWRLEHSRVLLDQVNRETRRRRRSLASLHRVQHSEETEADNMTWHDEDAIDTESESQGLLARLTRTVVKDILGIDDRLLSILLGNTAVEDDSELSTTPRASQTLPLPGDSEEQSWQLRLLERISQELGLLVNQLSHHPGAFTAYTRMQQMPIPYAGLPVIPEAGDATPAAANTREASSRASQPEFQPTVHRAPQPMDIPKAVHAEPVDDLAFTKDEWEQELDIKLVFRYLISRFRSRSNGSSSSAYTGVNTTQDAAARIARVRQHHPLISRSRPVERRMFRPPTPSSPVAMRHHSSCASQSTRRSARRSSGSSRHYWDIGGSLGTGSVISPHGPMGSWGEV